MIAIRQEIAQELQSGVWTATDNPLTNAPHTQADLMDDIWHTVTVKKSLASPLNRVKRANTGQQSIALTTSLATATSFCTCPSIDNYE